MEMFQVNAQIKNKTYHSSKVSSVIDGLNECEQKRRNQINYLKAKVKKNGMYIRKDKTSAFEPIVTNDFLYLRDCWKDYADWTYTASGLNVKQREVVIIDCDDTDFGKKMLELIEESNIKFNYIRVKPNGHAQIGIFIDRVDVRTRNLERNTRKQSESNLFTAEQWDYIKTYWSSFLEETHISLSKYVNDDCVIDINRLYLTVVQLLNLNMNGDLCYTGYCCQNAYSTTDGATVTWYDEFHKYTIGELFVESLKYSVNKNLKIKRERKAYERKEHKSLIDDYSVETIEVEDKVIEQSVIQELTKKITDAYRNSIDHSIFEKVAYCKKVCYKKNVPLTFEYAIKSIKNEGKSLTKDYTDIDITNHVMNSVEYINEFFDIEKAGFNDCERRISLVVRDVQSLQKWVEIKNLKEQGLTQTKIATELGINTKTVYRLLKKSFEDWKVEELLMELPKVEKYKEEYEFLLSLVNNTEVEEKVDTNTIIERLTETKSQEELIKCDKETEKFINMLWSNLARKNHLYIRDKVGNY